MAHVVALALSSGVPLFELAAPCAIFGTDLSELAGTEWYQFQACGVDGSRVDSWFTVATPYTYDDLTRADTVIVPACHDVDLMPPADLVDAVRQAARNGARVASICTGAFTLAAAGLLDGRSATTHWAHTTRLAARHPNVRVDPAPLYIDHGDVLTSAGKSAGVDMCLHIVRTDYGAATANRVAKRLVAPPFREGHQSQYIEYDRPQSGRSSMTTTIEWALANLDQPLSVEQLARHAGLSARTLHRHFLARTGTNPLDWLNTQRIRRAQDLLETTDRSIEWIATACGYGTPVALRRHFRDRLDTTPDNYRRTFRATG